MFKNVKQLAAGITFVVILATISLADCSSGVSQNQSSSSGQQLSTSTDTQSDDQSAKQQQPGSLGQQPSGASDMTAILTRAAEILGISSDDFMAAFNNAMPAGGPGPGQQGQSPAPPSGEPGQPPAPPSGEQGQPPVPPSGQQMSQSPFMAEVCVKVAAELNISADDIAQAIEQAEKESQE